MVGFTWALLGIAAVVIALAILFSEKKKDD